MACSQGGDEVVRIALSAESVISLSVKNPSNMSDFSLSIIIYVIGWERLEKKAHRDLKDSR